MPTLRSPSRAERRSIAARALVGLTAGAFALAVAAPAAAAQKAAAPAGGDRVTRAIAALAPAEEGAVPAAAPLAATATVPTSATGGPVAAGAPVARAAGVAFAPSATVPAHAADHADEERRRRDGSTLRQNLALIGVGVAAIIIGDTVDDTPGVILEVGGLGLVLYGAYRIFSGE